MEWPLFLLGIALLARAIHDLLSKGVDGRCNDIRHLLHRLACLLALHETTLDQTIFSRPSHSRGGFFVRRKQWRNTPTTTPKPIFPA